MLVAVMFDMDVVRETLPAHAQEILKEAFNSAWDQYDKPSKRRGKVSREETSMKVAWSAVKKKSEKRGGEWVAKED